MRSRCIGPTTDGHLSRRNSAFNPCLVVNRCLVVDGERRVNGRVHVAIFNLVSACGSAAPHIPRVSSLEAFGSRVREMHDDDLAALGADIQS